MNNIINIVKNVLRDHSKEDWAVNYVPHGINEKAFYPIINDLDINQLKLLDEFVNLDDEVLKSIKNKRL